MTVVTAIENGQSGGGYLLRYGRLDIPFEIEFQPRTRLTIHVHPDLRLEVLAPENRSHEAVLHRVKARSAWIAKQWRYFERYQPTQPKREYVSGETHRYLGRQYRLKVIKSSEAGAKLVGKFLYVFQFDVADCQATQELVDQWYRRHAELTFTRRLSQCAKQCKSLGLASLPEVAVRRMTRRWGSCTKTGNISLNLELIKVPIHCIDYVIIHELCHLKIHDHSPRFYRALSRVLPNWEERKERLESQDWS